MWFNYHAQCIYLCNANASLNMNDSQLHVKAVQGSVLLRIKLKVRVGYDTERSEKFGVPQVFVLGPFLLCGCTNKTWFRREEL